MCIDGSYSVKTSYKILCEENVHVGNASPNFSLPKSFWSMLWKLKVSMKVKHFLWRACNDSLPTKFNPCKRKIVQDSTCSLCQREPETIFHALWGCDELLVCGRNIFQVNIQLVLLQILSWSWLILSKTIKKKNKKKSAESVEAREVHMEEVSKIRCNRD